MYDSVTKAIMEARKIEISYAQELGDIGQITHDLSR